MPFFSPDFCDPITLLTLLCVFLPILLYVVLSSQQCLIFFNPMDCSLPGSPVHGDFPGKNTGVGCHALLQGLFPTRGLNQGLLHCKWILLLTEPPGKPMNTGMGSLFLLQGIFLTQESNPGILHCRRIIYQLNYQGSPSCYIAVICNFQTERLKL